MLIPTPLSDAIPLNHPINPIGSVTHHRALVLQCAMITKRIHSMALDHSRPTLLWPTSYAAHDYDDVDKVRGGDHDDDDLNC